MTVELELLVDGSRRVVDPAVLVVVGYTGADRAAVVEHIDELAAAGVPPPPRVPMYWAMPANTLTQGSSIEVPGPATSGEVELALVVDGTDVFLAAGSDHTCREAEAIDIRLSKLICPTPLSTDALPWSDVADRWADLELSSAVSARSGDSGRGGGEPVMYQSATAGGNRPPHELLDRIPWAGERPRSFVVLCGTVPVIGGIRPADRFEGSIHDPASGRTLTVAYDVRPVPPLTTT